ncbi:Multidrug resistance protein 1 [Entophlyctis luteolus]|nr:Multidrug resistance protein 1 [Entophlyctis luteolus]
MVATSHEVSSPRRTWRLTSTFGTEKTAESAPPSKEPIQVDPQKAKVPFAKLFRYATSFDYILMGIGACGGIANGLSQPVMTLVFGDIMQSLIDYPYTQDDDKLRSDVVRGVIYLTIMGCVVAAAAYAQMALWIWAGERQAKKLREEYFQSVLRQDMAWFDKTQTGEITTRMTGDIAAIQDGISDKVGQIIQSLSGFIGGFVIAFSKGWKLSLVLCCAFPLLGGAATLMGKSLANRKSAGSDAYAEAGAIAQEVLSSLRTVVSFGGQSRELARYTAKLQSAESTGIRGAVVNGLSTGVAFMIIFMTYGLGFWYGGQQIPAAMSSGQVITVFFSIIIGAIGLGNMGPAVAAISTATGVAGKIFETIDRESPIDPLSMDGKRPDTCEGEVVFSNVNFHYPQRPDVPILKSFSLRVPSGSTVALVGASGSGKSTIVKLLERWYDPIEGEITVDGTDIRELNVGWLRRQIGIVGQEPVLFDRSVRENLVLGMKEDSPEASHSRGQLDALIEKACKTANAWNFIQTLPNGISTGVGEAGTMLSGGQKQRIAIARAVMRDPKILLLDEATSALDTESERVVQVALDSAARNRTTIVVAHRLSTIKNADLIVVMGDGQIIEQGTHNELLDRKGAYADLVAAQALREAADDTSAPNTAVDSSASPKIDLKAVQPSTPKAEEFIVADAFVSRKDVDAISIPIADDAAKAVEALKSVKAKREIKLAAEEAEKKAEKMRLKRKLPFGRLYLMNASEWWILTIGIFSGIITVFGNPNDDDRNAGIRFWAIMFVVIAVSAFVVNSVSIICFGTAGERLTKKIRSKTFEALLRQEISFFDDEKHSTGVLVGNLSDDAFQVQGLVGQTMASVVQLCSTVASGFVIAFASGWQLTLVVLGTMPFMAIAGQMQMSVLSGFGSKTKEAYEDASNIANEAVDQVRTVLTITKEEVFYNIYKASLDEPHRVGIKGGFVASIGFAFGQAVIFLTYGLALYAGSEFTIKGIMTAPNVLKVMFAVIFTAIAMGQIASLAPNYVKAKLGALNIFDLLDRSSRIDPTSREGRTVGHDNVQGMAKLEDGVFNYPARPDIRVLDGMRIQALPGQTVALVGSSGCGKSTVIGILERWYDLISGVASFDDANVRDWNVANLRSHLALVGQEPVLFNTSIRENIAYGAVDGVATQGEIEVAARRANIADFVASLPAGYDTIVGSKGGQISGGQKQRIAIARALIRNPKLLLLDEATSALDSESEKVVQAALDAASEGRTTIVIAHRLSTIQNADLIVVAKSGKVVEQGTYEELLKLDGLFSELVAAQSLSRKEDGVSD